MARAQSRIGRNESEVAVEAVRDQHAIERIAVVPIEAARRLRVRPVDWELEKPSAAARGDPSNASFPVCRLIAISQNAAALT